MPNVSKPKPRKPSKEYGEAAVALARQVWKTQAEILREMGYTADPKSETLRRLERGGGSDESARGLYDALKRKGVDVSKLPPMYPDEEAAAREQTWRQEWLWIGEMLHEYAPPMYEQNVERLRELARVLARQAGHENEIFRAT